MQAISSFACTQCSWPKGTMALRTARPACTGKLPVTLAVRRAPEASIRASSAAPARTPSTAGEKKELPVFPVISMHDYENRKDEIADELVRAASKMGFFYVSGHGISQDEIDAAFAMAERTFALPRETKERYPYVPDTNLGYRSPEDMELRTGNKFFECFGISPWGVGRYDPSNHKRTEQWPVEFGPEFRMISTDLSRKAHNVAVKIAKALFRGLGRDESEVDEPLDIKNPENPSYLAFNHYPGLTDKELAVLESGGELPPRLFAHSDGFVITVLFNVLGTSGLEVASSDEVENADEITNNLGDAWHIMPKIKEWTPMDPRPGCLVINVGDMLTRWTDGALHTNFHQARAPRLGENTGPQKKYPAYTPAEFLEVDGKGYTDAPNMDVWYKSK